MELFEPLRFRNGVIAQNRLALAALTNQQSHADGSWSNEERAWLSARARGGFGVITTCAAYVADEGRTWPGAAGIAHDTHLPSLTALGAELREAGALGLVQLFHGGLRANRAVSGLVPWSASAALPGEPEHRAATDDDLGRVVEAFVAAAQRAERAGMSGVELHGAHGYLLAQFLSAVENRRTDAWGGALENRARLLRTVLTAVRAGVSSSFVVGVRLSPEDFRQSRGIDLDETVQVARWLADDGADFVHLSLWDAARNSQKYPDEHPTLRFRRVLPEDVPILVAGKIWTRAEAERELARGASAIALGRAAIVNPAWPNSAREPSWQPQQPPVSAEALARASVSPGFVAYLRRGWPGFVAE